MTAQKSVDVGNTHLETIMDYTKTMVAANRVQPEKAPAFMNALSEAMLETLNKFESVAEATARAAVVASDAAKDKSRRAAKEEKTPGDNNTKTSSEKKGEKVTEYAKTAKMREAFTREGNVPAELPAVAAAYRYVTPKRGVGRPRKDAPVPVISDQQRAFDCAFIEKYPVLPGLTAENSFTDDEITILFDGKKLKMIGRHLFTRYGINTEDYKRIYSLPDDYPICAPGYRNIRRSHAKKQGLGTAKVPKTPKASKVGADVVSLSGSNEGAAARKTVAA
ncbi:hypothetical protein GOB57_24725 [Sinorhizobium meliloti]|nr:hypothetical protein [Sinorhizobium meliloti]